MKMINHWVSNFYIFCIHHCPYSCGRKVAKVIGSHLIDKNILNIFKYTTKLSLLWHVVNHVSFCASMAHAATKKLYNFL